MKREVELAKKLLESKGYKVTENARGDRASVARALIRALDDESILNALGSVRSIDPAIYKKAQEMMSSGEYSLSAVAKEISDDLVLSESKKMKESFHELFQEQSYSISDLISYTYGSKESFAEERDGTEELDVPCEMLGGNYSNVYMLCDEDASRDVFSAWSDIEKRDVKTVRKDSFYCILVSTNAGDYVYQNMWGMITIFKKF